MNEPPILSCSQPFFKLGIAFVALGMCLPVFFIVLDYLDVPRNLPETSIILGLTIGFGMLLALIFIPIFLSLGNKEYVFKEDGFSIKERRSGPFSLVRKQVKEFAWQEMWAWREQQGVIPMRPTFLKHILLTKQGDKIKIDDFGDKLKYEDQKIEYDKFIKHLYKYLAPLENHQEAFWEEMKKMRWLGYLLLFLGVAFAVSVVFFVVVGLVYGKFALQLVVGAIFGAVVCFRFSRNYLV